MPSAKSIKVLASHSFKPTAKQLKEARELVYGRGPKGDELAQAKAGAAEHCGAPCA